MNTFEHLHKNPVLHRLAEILESQAFVGISEMDYLHGVERCRDHFRRSSSDSSHSFYEVDSKIFTRRYLRRNVFKNYYLILELQELGLLRYRCRIVDLGCGSGAFLFALAARLDEDHLEPENSFSVQMVDASPQALGLFETLWASIKKETKQQIKYNPVCSTIDGDIRHLCREVDLIVLSNSLIEILRDNKCRRTAFLNTLLDSGAAIALIDYEYLEHRHLLEEFARVLRGKYNILTHNNDPATNSVFQMIHLPISENGPPRYSFDASNGLRFIMSILVPNNPRATRLSHNDAWRLLSTYKLAWERHDEAKLRDLFTIDAVYCEKADSPPFCGIEQILNYWRLNAVQQRDVVFTPGQFAIEGDCIIAQWHCSFYRIDKSKWYELRGSLRAYVRDTKIYRFEEEFQKNRTSPLNCQTRSMWSTLELELQAR